MKLQRSDRDDTGAGAGIASQLSTVLFLAANPIRHQSLHLDEEYRTIEQRIRSARFRSLVRLRSCWAARPDDLLQVLHEEAPAVLHFSGHGAGAQGLCFQSDDGGAVRVSAEGLALVIQAAGPSLQIVVLNEIERVEVLPDSSDHVQPILMGEAPPAWAVIAAPNATCTSRFVVDIVGARLFARKDLSLQPTGNLVLTTLDDYRDLLHLTLLIGAGFVFPQQEPLSKPRGEPHATIGMGVERYYEKPFPGALEVNLIYEPGFIAYGAIPHPQTSDQAKVNLPYERLMFEIIGTYWGRNRDWQAGVMAGGGAGGPIFGEADKVGGFHKFLFGGMLVRWHFYPASLHASIQLDAGIRWGEKREYFGTTDSGDPNENRFHGEPGVAELRLPQVYSGLRWRISIK